MSKYTEDDNRSMQLNDNNERYCSSRGEDPDEDDGEEQERPTRRRTKGSYSKNDAQWDYQRWFGHWPSDKGLKRGTNWDGYDDE